MQSSQWSFEIDMISYETILTFKWFLVSFLLDKQKLQKIQNIAHFSETAEKFALFFCEVLISD